MNKVAKLKVDECRKRHVVYRIVFVCLLLFFFLMSNQQQIMIILYKRWWGVNLEELNWVHSLSARRTFSDVMKLDRLIVPGTFSMVVILELSRCKLMGPDASEKTTDFPGYTCTGARGKTVWRKRWTVYFTRNTTAFLIFYFFLLTQKNSWSRR